MQRAQIFRIAKKAMESFALRQKTDMLKYTGIVKRAEKMRNACCGFCAGYKIL